VFTDQIMQAKSYFLVADAGWEENKKETWPSADLEETITLKNSDSGIALFHDEEIIDAVGWGVDPLYVKGQPVEGVQSGEVLLRINTTGDNAGDFISSQPFAAQSHDNETTLQMQLAVYDPRFSLNASITQDDSEKEGVQFLPLPGQQRELFVYADPAIQTKAFFENQEVMFQEGMATLLIDYALPPKEYSISIEATKDNYTASQKLSFEILPLLAFSIDAQTIDLGNITPGKRVTSWGDHSSLTPNQPTVQNIGNVVLDIGLSGTDLISDAGVINISQVRYSFDNEFSSETSGSLFYTKEIIDLNLDSEDSLPLSIQVDVPETAKSGVYRGSVFVTAVLGQ